MSDLSASGDLVPYDLEADAHLIWPAFEHERLAVGDVFCVHRDGKPDRVLRVTRVIPGPDGQVMYDTEPADDDAPEVTPENAQRLLTKGKITINQAREAYGFPPFDPPLEPLAIPAGAGDWLRAILGPLGPEPPDGPPYTHVLRQPETEEEMTAAMMLPAHTTTNGKAGE